MTQAWALPPQDRDFSLAAKLLAKDPPLDRRIVEALVGTPKRYSELKPLLGGRNDNVLTKALHRLRNEGIIQQGLSHDLKETRYMLTELGKLVIFRLHEMIPHHQSIEAYQRGMAALHP